jgi:hypothetical protein
MKKNTKQLSFTFNEIDSIRNEILEDEFTIDTLKSAELLIKAQITLAALNGDGKSIEQYMKYIIEIDEHDLKNTEINITKVIFKDAK